MKTEKEGDVDGKRDGSSMVLILKNFSGTAANRRIIIIFI